MILIIPKSLLDLGSRSEVVGRPRDQSWAGVKAGFRTKSKVPEQWTAAWVWSKDISKTTSVSESHERLSQTQKGDRAGPKLVFLGAL